MTTQRIPIAYRQARLLYCGAQSKPVKYMVSALQDVVPMFDKAVHFDPKEFLEKYKEEVQKAVEEVSKIMPD